MVKKLIKIGFFIAFISTIIATLIIGNNRHSYEELTFNTYNEALNWEIKEVEEQLVVIRDIKVDDAFDNTNLIIYGMDDVSKVYISKIVSAKSGFQYYRLSPTLSWKTEDVNVSFDIPVNINDKTYYVLVGKVGKAYGAYSNEEELELDNNRIFIKINPKEKNQVSFKK